MFLDLLILVLLPRLKVSHGPPTLSLVILGLLRLPFILLPLPAAIVFQLLGTAMVIWGFVVEPQIPVLKSCSIPTKNIEWTNFRIVHLNDLHMAYFSHLEERDVRQVNALHPDPVIFTGDFFNLSQQADPQTALDIRSFFSRIKTKTGIFAVSGSPSIDLQTAMANLNDIPHFTLLDDKSAIIEIDGIMIKLYGLNCTHRPDDDAVRFQELLKSDPISDGYNILLYHSPDLAPAISKTSIDLQLSGHSHGGQVQIPIIGPIFTASVYGSRLAQGHFHLNHSLHLIVSHGLGLEGLGAPRVRFCNPP